MPRPCWWPPSRFAGCDVLVQSIDGGAIGGGYKATDTWSRTYPVGAPGMEVAVVNINGKIQVEAVEGTVVDVKAEIIARAGSDQAAKELLKQVEIREETSPARIRLETRQRRTFGRQGVQVLYTLRVPKTVKVNLETVNGGINIVGIEGGTRAETTNGTVEGRLLSSGVRAATTNGSIKLEVSSLGAEGAELETTNGSIDLRLPESTKANLSARCVNGGIAVEGLTFEKVERARAGGSTGA